MLYLDSSVTDPVSRVVLVGELNPYRDDPKYDLHPDPANCAGHRMMRHLGLDSTTYTWLGRVNLCRGSWNRRDAELAAAAILADRRWKVVVTLGRRVADAFGFTGPWFSWNRYPGRDVLSVPHPSGRSRVWNDRSSRERLRAALTELEPDVAWGAAEGA